MSKRRINIVPCEEYVKEIMVSIAKGFECIVRQYYQVKVDEKWGVPNRIKKEHFIVYVMMGEVTYDIMDKKYRVKAGQIFFISKQVAHAVSVRDNQKASFISIHFECVDPNRSGTEVINDNKGAFGFLQPGKEHKIASLFKEVTRTSSMEQWVRKSYHHGLMIQLLCLLIESKGRKRSNIKDLKMDDIKVYMENNFREPYAIEDYAIRCGMSRKHFTRRFSEAHSCTPKAFILHQKMNYATFLLCENNMRVKDVAEYLGYSDPYTFSKQYKKVIGTSPVKRKYKEDA